ncbi:MAG: hypothetical protein U9N35_06970 [Euryarchaeota archaeon]|nr:hypothetical protein [Euryarchaeota archaeon]
MKKIGLTVLISLLLMGISHIQGFDDVSLEYSVEYGRPLDIALVGDEVKIHVKLRNTSGDNVWNCKVEIDKEKISAGALPFIDFKKDVAEFREPMKYKMHDEIQEDQVTLTIVFKKGIRGGTYEIPLLFTGKVGPCIDGCISLRPQKKVIEVPVIIPKPMLTIQTSGRVEANADSAEIPFVLKNGGTAKAENIVITTSPQSIPSEVKLDSKVLATGAEMNGTVLLDVSTLSTGVYPVEIDLTYSDEDLNNEEKKKTVDVVVTREVTQSTTPPSTEVPQGDPYYNQAMQSLSDGSYGEAINSLIKAKMEYSNSGNTEKALECENQINSTIGLLSKQNEEENGVDRPSVIIGLLVGVILSGAALTLWLYNEGAI